MVQYIHPTKGPVKPRKYFLQKFSPVAVIDTWLRTEYNQVI